MNTTLNDLNIETDVSGADGIADPADALTVPFDGNGFHEFRDKNGNKDFVRLLFGAISLLFCIRVLFTEIIN